MAKSYRAVTRIKSNGKELDRGDKVTASAVGGDDELDELIEAGSVVTEAEFNVSFPGFDDEAGEGLNQPTGTPSNLGDVEGTELESEEGKEAAESAAKIQLEKAEADAKAAKEAAKSK